MKSIIVDFDHIASRLNQIEQEKHETLTTTNTAEQISAVYHMYGMKPDDVFKPEYIGCWRDFTFTFYPGTDS